MGNRQAESAAAKLAGWRRIHLMKLLEQARLLFGGQPDAGIGDVEPNPPWTRHLHGETDFSGWRELHRIAEQVRNHLADAQIPGALGLLALVVLVLWFMRGPD